MKILLTGGYGFLGSHLYSKLVNDGHCVTRYTKEQFDLRNRIDANIVVDFARNPDVVIHLAAKVGGIGANAKNPGLFMYDNLIMGINIIEAARSYNIKKFIMMGTICSYPKYTPVPFKEEDIWNGYPEETNAGYGLAKKTLMELLISYNKQYNFNATNLLAVNMYGGGDSTDIENNHVIPAIIQKVYDAKLRKQDYINIWGTGKVSREFLYVEDCVDAISLAISKDVGPQPINIGTGKEITILDLVKLICKLMDYNGKIVFDTSRPDGQPRRCLDVSKAKKLLDFEAKTDLEIGLKKTIGWFYDKFGNL